MPGLKVSRTTFRPRMARRVLLLDRFLQDRHLLCVFDGSTKRGVTGFEGSDLAAKGARLELRGVKEEVVFGEQCIALAAEDPHGPRIQGCFTDIEADPEDALRMSRCNFTCRTTPMASMFGSDVSGYSVAMDVCMEDAEDQFLMTGGNGDPNREQYSHMRGRMVLDLERPGLYIHNRDSVRVERRSIGDDSQPCRVVDVTTDRILWQRSKPWFALRYGNAYLLTVVLKQGITEDAKKAARQKIQEKTVACFGTPHGKPDKQPLIERWELEQDVYHLHFFDRWDYVEAFASFGRMDEVEVTEHKQDVAAEVFAVLVRYTRVQDANNRVVFPPGQDHGVWTYTFELPPSVTVKRERWHSVAACVDQRWGVSLYADGVLIGNRMLPEGVVLFIDPQDSRMALSSFSSAGGLPRIALRVRASRSVIDPRHAAARSLQRVREEYRGVQPRAECDGGAG